MEKERRRVGEYRSSLHVVTIYFSWYILNMMSLICKHMFEHSFVRTYITIHPYLIAINRICWSSPFGDTLLFFSPSLIFMLYLRLFTSTIRIDGEEYDWSLGGYRHTGIVRWSFSIGHRIRNTFSSRYIFLIFVENSVDFLSPSTWIYIR